VREATVWRGHAVRALYLSAAAVDVAVEQNDDELLASIERQWTATVARRTYITGGMGSRHQDEGFGEDWELPPDRAYCETCAGVASVMVSWRLFLATGDVRYADLIERTFYNVIATSPRADGRAFFYANPLQQRVDSSPTNDDLVSPRADGGTRAAWVRRLVLPDEHRSHPGHLAGLCRCGGPGRRGAAAVRQRSAPHDARTRRRSGA